MPYPTTLEIIGGRGGDSFSFTGENNGASLEKIWVWVGEWQVKAVKVWLSDGRSRTFGEPSGSHQEYVFQPGECFTSLSLWRLHRVSLVRDDTRLGAIKFETNKGGRFCAEWKLKKEFFVDTSTTEYPVDVGSGYCLGVEGRCGADIDSMGFMFLNAVESAVLTDVNYPTINQLIPQVTVEELDSMTYTNETSINQEQKIETSKKVTKQSSWSMSTSITATLSVEVQAGVPKVTEVSHRYSVSVGAESTYSQQQTEEKTKTLTTTVVVPPKKKVVVDITIGRATFDLPYTGTVKITCKNGSVLEYETKGQYKGVSYIDIKVKTKESNL